MTPTAPSSHTSTGSRPDPGSGRESLLRAVEQRDGALLAQLSRRWAHRHGVEALEALIQEVGAETGLAIWWREQLAAPPVAASPEPVSAEAITTETAGMGMAPLELDPAELAGMFTPLPDFEPLPSFDVQAIFAMQSAFVPPPPAAQEPPIVQPVASTATERTDTQAEGLAALIEAAATPLLAEAPLPAQEAAAVENPDRQVFAAEAQPMIAAAILTSPSAGPLEEPTHAAADPAPRRGPISRFRNLVRDCIEEVASTFQPDDEDRPDGPQPNRSVPPSPQPVQNEAPLAPDLLGSPPWPSPAAAVAPPFALQQPPQPDRPSARRRRAAADAAAHADAADAAAPRPAPAPNHPSLASLRSWLPDGPEQDQRRVS